MIIEIECLPSPAGSSERPYRHVEAAIAVIEDSGLRYEVEALGTTVEGEPDELWPLLRRVHEACLGSGALSLITVIKAQQTATGPVPTIEGLTAAFRSRNP